jgi:hypothetical protein
VATRSGKDKVKEISYSNKVMEIMVELQVGLMMEQISQMRLKYPTNDFGLYDMAGNVADRLQDVYEPIVDNEANDFNYFRGNQYKK